MKRVPIRLRSLFAASGVAVLFAGGLVFGMASPAPADPPHITMSEECGSALFTWDTGTIGGDETWATTVLRNGVAVDEFQMRERGNRRYGAVDGDVFVVRRAGLPDRDMVYREPEGCADAPKLKVTAENLCHTLELHLSNEGSAPITGLRLLSAASPAPEELAPVEPGSVTLVRRLADGASYLLVSGTPGPAQVTWIAGTYRQAAGCGPEAIAAELADACDGVEVTLVSRADAATRVAILIDGAAVRHQVVPARATERFTLVAATGAVVVARNAELALDLATHTVAPAPCTSPTPSPSLSLSPSVSPEPGDGPGSGAGGGLPVTGAPGIALLVAGGALLAGGAVFLIVARRRRIRFTGSS